ncbi:Putative secretion protein, HlyD-family (fragment) [Curtobacterium sp. 8I-2]
MDPHGRPHRGGGPAVPRGRVRERADPQHHHRQGRRHLPGGYRHEDNPDTDRRHWVPAGPLPRPEAGAERPPDRVDVAALRGEGRAVRRLGRRPDRGALQHHQLRCGLARMHPAHRRSDHGSQPTAAGYSDHDHEVRAR